MISGSSFLGFVSKIKLSIIVSSIVPLDNILTVLRFASLSLFLYTIPYTSLFICCIIGSSSPLTPFPNIRVSIGVSLISPFIDISIVLSVPSPNPSSFP